MDRPVRPWRGKPDACGLNLVDYVRQLPVLLLAELAILCLLPMLRLARAAKLRQLDSLIIYQCTSAWVRLQDPSAIIHLQLESDRASTFWC